MRIEINDKNPGELIIIGEHELDFARMASVFMKLREGYAVRKEEISGERFRLCVELKKK